jgi:hypothetical protein
MSVTLTTVRFGNVTTVTAASTLSGIVYYHWYLDGVYVATSVESSHSFWLGTGEQIRIEVTDTLDPDYDPIANAPAGWPARKAITWARSLDTDVAEYRVEQQKDSGSWTTVGIIPHDATKWSYSLLSGRLTDLSSYYWRVYPVDAAGNDGTAITPVKGKDLVRRPDAPNFTISFDDGTTKVTFTAA